jgi:hypothetical protein
MKSAEAKSKFKARLAERGGGNRPEEIIDCMLDFYREVRAEDCDLEGDGDMLLLQWGTHDWGAGKWFELDITRQFLVGDGEDDQIFQLSATAKYKPSRELDSLGAGNRWCENLRKVGEFSEFIASSAPMTLLRGTTPDKVEIDYVCAG